MIGPFECQLHENQVNAPDYKVYNITYENTSVLFQIISTEGDKGMWTTIQFQFRRIHLALFLLI